MLLLSAAIVGAVLAAGVVSALIPGLDRVMAGLPIVIVLLLVGTVALLARIAFRR